VTDSVVVDTNVLVVANGKTPQASVACVLACIHELELTRAGRCVLVDDVGLIFQEYRHHLSPSGQPGPGDAFFKWLWDNQGHSSHCRRVAITSVDGSDWNFAEFPDDAQLAAFDRNDRKFVAVSIASGESAPILNASDTDWWAARDVLAAHGVEVRFLCPELMGT
jgi:hypothetical protein